MGLKINEAKSKYMAMNTTEIEDGSYNNLTIKVSENKVLEFEKVSSFVDLGVLVTQNIDDSKEIGARIARANRSAGSLTNFLNSKIKCGFTK